MEHDKWFWCICWETFSPEEMKLIFTLQPHNKCIDYKTLEIETGLTYKLIIMFGIEETAYL